MLPYSTIPEYSDGGHEAIVSWDEGRGGRGGGGGGGGGGGDGGGACRFYLNRSVHIAKG